jgi:hypothetical protein
MFPPLLYSALLLPLLQPSLRGPGLGAPPLDPGPSPRAERRLMRSDMFPR